MTITEQMTVGDIAAVVPGSVRVFRKHGLDFCCGGKKPLGTACEEAGLSVSELASEIEAAAVGAPADARDWTQASLARIIRHIVATYHEPLRHDLPQLEAMAAKVLQVHGGHDRAGLTRLHAIVAELTADLTAHMRKEELALFPAIERVESGLPAGLPIAAPIDVMEAEHDRAGALLFELRLLTDDYVPPSWACGTVKALYQQLDQLEQAMHLHVHLENNVLFPRALALLQPHA
jgi:regulator of cell morphogenesis and NO signaling